MVFIEVGACLGCSGCDHRSPIGSRTQIRADRKTEGAQSATLWEPYRPSLYPMPNGSPDRANGSYEPPVARVSWPHHPSTWAEAVIAARVPAVESYGSRPALSERCMSSLFCVATESRRSNCQVKGVRGGRSMDSCSPSLTGRASVNHPKSTGHQGDPKDRCTIPLQPSVSLDY